MPDEIIFCGFCAEGRHSICRVNNYEHHGCICHLLEHPRLPFPKELLHEEE